MTQEQQQVFRSADLEAMACVTAKKSAMKLLFGEKGGLSASQLSSLISDAGLRGATKLMNQLGLKDGGDNDGFSGNPNHNGYGNPSHNGYGNSNHNGYSGNPNNASENSDNCLTKNIESLLDGVAETLFTYRRYCANKYLPRGQLILPEALKFMPIYTLGMIKSPAFRSNAPYYPPSVYPSGGAEFEHNAVAR